jgi:hypothetical protein
MDKVIDLGGIWRGNAKSADGQGFVQGVPGDRSSFNRQQAQRSQ